MIPKYSWMMDMSWYRYNEDRDEMELTKLAPDSVKPEFKKYLDSLRKFRKENPGIIVEPI